MALEIERKFLPKDPSWRPRGKSERLVQGYFWLMENATAHIRHDLFPRAQDAFTLVLRPRDHATILYSLPARDGSEILQTCPNYLTRKWTMRVRHSSREGGCLTIKGPMQGITRHEYEYALSDSLTRKLLALSVDTHIIKDRYKIDYRGHRWDVDVYDGHLAGSSLVTCEIELKDENATFPRPPWLGREVTDIREFSNGSMARRRPLPALYPE